jgi:hypothetical protein
MILVLGFHLFGPLVLRAGLYSQLFGALLGGLLVICSVNVPIRHGEKTLLWLGRERLAWTLIGAGACMWGLGECVYRYLLARNLPNFPALSDAGYASMPVLVFAGLLLQPSSGSGPARLLVLLDSLISMGAILAIAWFLLLGSLAQAPGEANLAKFLGLYYPLTDMALLSCVIFLLLRSQGRVYEAGTRRLSLLLIGVGVCVFAVSDFNYNVQNNMGTYVDGTWADLGWPLGLMIIGLAAYLHRFLPAPTADLVEKRIRRHEEHPGFGFAQLVPYLLLGFLLLVLSLNVLSSDATQVWNRPVLLFATVCVVGLVVVRQLITQQENERLSQRQQLSLERLAAANARVEEQARMIAEHSASLEEGITHLKGVQAQLANGNLRARARISRGNLVSLAGSLNLMADRLMRFEQVDSYAQGLTRALHELSRAFDLYRASGKFVQPPGCHTFPEIGHLLLAMGMKQSFASEPNPGAPSQQGDLYQPGRLLSGSGGAAGQSAIVHPPARGLPTRQPAVPASPSSLRKGPVPPRPASSGAPRSVLPDPPHLDFPPLPG